MADVDDWLAELNFIFAATLERVPDAGFAEPTALPGWTTAHVVAHVHFNALALCRLVGWARTGAEAAMYASAAHRNEEIESGAGEPPVVLRRWVRESAKRFVDEFAALNEPQRGAIVITAQSRHIPAAELAWLRCRELGIHAVDLDAGTTFADLPARFTAALVDEIVAKRIAGGEGAALAAWLAGRDQPGAGLGRWL